LKETRADFSARWLAEAVRLSLAETVDPDAERQARQLDADAEPRVLRWAAAAAERIGLHQALQLWRQRLVLLVIVLAALALAGGFTAALTVLGDGERSVNILWAVGALLGLQLLMLVLWLAGMLIKSDGPLGGRLVFWLSARLTGGINKSLFRAFFLVNSRAALTPWWLALISHIIWLAAMAGALAGLLWALALRSYVFIWETTILPTEVFAQLVGILSVAPQWLGFAMPEPTGIADITAASADQVRRAWASWLTGQVFVFGVLPRLFLVVVAGGRILFSARRLRLPLHNPEWSRLLQRLMPEDALRAVTDPAPVPPGQARIQPNRQVDRQARALVAFELSAQQAWPPADVPAGIRIFSVDNRHERQQILSELAELTPARLLLVCDASISPDRGTLHWFVSAGSLAGDTSVCLLNHDHASTERLAAWHEAMTDIGIGSSAISESLPEALGELGVAHE
jgi:hypothetical protein